ncbi:MAG: dTMP kinase [Agarilytica sp.]
MVAKFITVEGTEGVGKSTNIAFIQSLLEARGIEFCLTREPGGTPLAEEVREILLAKRDESFNPTAELLMIFAARAQHIQQVIKPALDEGKWVISDRFTDATYAYQGHGRGLSLETIETLESLVQRDVQRDVQPDATFILDIDVKVGLERASQRGELDRFEIEKLDFFEKVRQGYHARVKQNPQRYHLIDAGQDLSKVQMDIKSSMERLF